MTNRTLALTDALYTYLRAMGRDEPAVMCRLREYTVTLPMGNMQIAPEQAQFMQFLLSVIQAKNVLEVGTFTGYSALAMALALPEAGHVLTCDKDVEWTKIAQKYWREAGVDRKITLRLAPAQETLAALLEDNAARTFDFVFIDADKVAYPEYYEYALQLLRPGGVVALDNAFMQGQVANDAVQKEGVLAIRRLNAAIRVDTRVTSSLVPIGDGLLLARKC